jgi:tRNA threonylcarbamoyl adenosine modification protein YeaZ/ribosomal-protein-alanine acetyltransferase
MVEAVFAEAGISPSALTRIAVTRGPGTFTGLRIGLAYARGMALALDVPLVGLDSLTAMAAPHFGGKGHLLVIQQAGGTGQFYWAAFDLVAAQALHAPAIGSLDAVVGFMGSGAWTATGSGAVALKARLPHVAVLTGAEPDAAVFVAYAATLAYESEVEPLYLRAPDAKPSVASDASTARVRLVQPADLETLSAIHMQSFPHGWTAESIAASLSLPGSGALVVELAGTVYGFVQYQWVAAEAEINTICVSPNYRRQHFGHDLLQGLIDYLKTIRTQKVFLEVAADNVAARGLYDRHGFLPTGRRKGYYAGGQDAIAMTLELAA